MTDRKNLWDIINSIVFGLPFSYYDKYYKSGELSRMTQEQKRDLFMEDQKDNQKREFIMFILKNRPSIMDADSEEEFFKAKNKYRYTSLLLGCSFMSFWSFFSYQFYLKRVYYFKSLLSVNFLCLVIYKHGSYSLQASYDTIYRKYKHIATIEELKAYAETDD